jgi:hypothetical protein
MLNLDVLVHIISFCAGFSAGGAIVRQDYIKGAVAQKWGFLKVVMIVGYI